MSAVLKTAAVARLANFAWRYQHLARNDASRSRVPAALPPIEGDGVQLTLAEYHDLQDILTTGKDELICEPFHMQKVDMGLRIYERPAGGSELKLLFTLVGAALPQEVRTAAHLVTDAYRELMPFACDEDNIGLLRYHRLEAPHSISWYE